MASFTGSFSGVSTSIVYPYIEYSYTQNIAGNYTDVSMSLYFYLNNTAYYGYNDSYPTYCNIDGENTYASGPLFSLNSGNRTALIQQKTKRVYHNADGTRTCWVGSNGDTQLYWGTWNFGQTIALPTIPRAASITSGLSLTIGNNLAYTLSNPGSLYVKLILYVWDGSGYDTVISSNRGTGSSGTITLGSSENNIMYAAMPSNTSRAGILRAYTYSDAGYSVQVGDYYDVNGTIYLDTATNKPVFTTYTVAAVDKNITVTDKYENTLITSATNTLTGSASKVISGYSKARATITSANKAVAQNYAAMVNYRFTAGAQYTEAAWQSGSTVNIDVDNVTTGSYSVKATDSRALYTTVNNSMTLISPTSVQIGGLTLSRSDGGIGATVTMAFSGSYWDEYFGGGSSGVLNAVVCQWRGKVSTHSWNALDGTCTISNASPAVVTKSTHGLVTGDMCWFSTTGGLPTGLTANTVTYFVIKNDANTFWLTDTYAHAMAGTNKINTSSAGSGTHTLRADMCWTTIVPTDTSGSLSYSATINGDLGAGGWSTNKSFDIEVRIYDKLSQMIISQILSVGTPVVDITQSGIAVKGVFDTDKTGALQIPSLTLNGTDITSSGKELNILDGVTATYTELNKVDNDTEWQAFTPSWTNLTVGNGTQVARYCRVGKTVDVYLNLLLGSSSSVGTNAYFALPVSPRSTADYKVGTGLFLNSGVNWVIGSCLVGDGYLYVWDGLTASGRIVAGSVSATAPFTWKANDRICVWATYECA